MNGSRSSRHHRHYRPVLALAAAGALAAAVTALAAPARAQSTATARLATTAGGAATTHTGPAAIVSLGDSAISGEGAGTDTNDGYIPPTDGPSDYCHRNPKAEIFDTAIPGITPFDIACGHANGMRTVAVAGGTHTADELRSHEPWCLLETLPPPAEFERRLGLT